MSDPMVLLAVAVAFWVGFPLVLRVLGAVLPILVSSSANAAEVVGGAARGTMRRSRDLFMENRGSVGAAVTLSVGSFYHMAEGAAIVATELLLAAATVAGLIGLKFSGDGMHYDLLLGVSTVFTALLFAETIANLIGYTKTMTLSSVDRGRIPTVLIAVGGFFLSLCLFGALAYYRSQMIAEDVNPAEVGVWVNFLPGGILVAMTTLYTIAAALAFTNLDSLFTSVAGIVCGLAAMIIGILGFVVRVFLLVVKLLLSVVNTVAVWWEEKNVLSATVSALFKGLVQRLNDLVAVTPARQAVVVKSSTEIQSIASTPLRADHELVPVNLARATEIDPEDRELVGVVASRGTTLNGHRADQWEFPG